MSGPDEKTRSRHDAVSKPGGPSAAPGPQHQASDLEELLDQLGRAADTDHTGITADDILSAVGTRTFAPLLMLVGSLIASPLSGIPGMPTVVAIIILTISVQMLFGRKHIWLPRWLLDRTVSEHKLNQAIEWLRPPARFIDRFIRPRLSVLVKGPAFAVIAVLCAVIALGMPLLEFVPFSSSIAGVALAAFGLALVSGDGLLALLAYLALGAVAWMGLAALL
tara:strand:- start:39838 stop:40503 length:666 start_codon:yes stop_codon:yes gene_type:complete